VRDDDQGAVRASASVTVVSTVITSGAVSRNRSVTRILSLCGVFAASCVTGEKPTVSTTSVSPSHLPTDVPKNFGSGSAGSGRPSV